MRLSGQVAAKASSMRGSSARWVFDHAGDDVAEERCFRRQILLALDLAAEPMAFELRQDLVEAGARHVHLVERLHRGEPRRPAAVGLARTGRFCGARLIAASPG